MSDIEAFDPTAPEGDVGRSQYMSAKDLKIIAGGLVILAAILFPVYKIAEQNSEKARCTQNLKAIGEALNLYATEHDGRYPPIARTETLGGVAPSLGDTGYPYTWASDIAGYMNVRASFLCPSAQPSEVVKIEDPKSTKSTLALSYGMYLPYGGYLTSLVENPDEAVIVAETSNRSALGTFDPVPFSSQSGAPLPDGFAIGWSDSNDDASKATTAVSRLAFPETSAGIFEKTGPARHGKGIQMLTASGRRAIATAEMARYRNPSTHLVNPMWNVPAGVRRSH